MQQTGEKGIEGSDQGTSQDSSPTEGQRTLFARMRKVFVSRGQAPEAQGSCPLCRPAWGAAHRAGDMEVSQRWALQQVPAGEKVALQPQWPQRWLFWEKMLRGVFGGF